MRSRTKGARICRGFCESVSVSLVLYYNLQSKNHHCARLRHCPERQMLSYENSFPSQQTKNIISRKEEKSKSPITPERRGHRRDKRREENNAGAILVTRERTPRSHVPGLSSSSSEYIFIPVHKTRWKYRFDIFQLGVQCKSNYSTFSYLPICKE